VRARFTITQTFFLVKFCRQGVGQAMPCVESVTALLVHLRAGDHAAAQPLWERYYPRLVGLARQRLRGTPRRVSDAEDVALSAFDSFCRGVEQGRFPQLKDRDGLWALLVLITVRKAADLVQYNRRVRRGGGQVRGDSALAGPDGDTGANGLAQIEAVDPTPRWRPNWPRNSRACLTGWAATSCAGSRCGNWKATLTPRSPAVSAAPPSASSAASA
jgi:DNA-directed RNA polymerase specialized sigma24 family protein